MRQPFIRLSLAVVFLAGGLAVYWVRSNGVAALGEFLTYSAPSLLHAAGCTILIGTFDERSYLFACLSTLLLISAFEGIQLFNLSFYAGTFDIVDIIFGVFGIIIGFGLLKLTEDKR